MIKTKTNTLNRTKQTKRKKEPKKIHKKTDIDTET